MHYIYIRFQVIWFIIFSDEFSHYPYMSLVSLIFMKYKTALHFLHIETPSV